MQNTRREAMRMHNPTTNRFALKVPKFRSNDLLQLPAKSNARVAFTASAATRPLPNYVILSERTPPSRKNVSNYTTLPYIIPISRHISLWQRREENRT